MNFKTKYRLRNSSLRLLLLSLSATAILCVYSFIKWQKVLYYGDWLYQNFDQYWAYDIKWLLHSYLSIGGIPLYVCLIMTLLIDVLLHLKVIKIS